MSVHIEITGLDKIMRMTDPAKFNRATERGLELAMAIWRDETKRMPPVSASRTGYGAKGIPVAPKYGGTLRQSIQARRVSSVAADVYGGVHYSKFVHDGTSKMPERPFFLWSLQDFGAMQKMEVALNQELTKAFNG